MIRTQPSHLLFAAALIIAALVAAGSEVSATILILLAGFSLVHVSVYFQGSFDHARIMLVISFSLAIALALSADPSGRSLALLIVSGAGMIASGVEHVRFSRHPIVTIDLTRRP